MMSEIDKQKLDLDSENENRWSDALDIFFLLYGFPKWHDIKEMFGYGDCFPDII